MSRRIAVVVGIVAATLMQSTLAHAAFPGLNGKIAFHSDRDGEVDVFGQPAEKLYSMNPDGTGQTRLTDLAPPGTDPLDIGEDREPAWSADGTRLVYSCGFYDGGDLCLASADGSDRQVFYRYRSPLASGEYLALLNPTFSPSGTRVAFTELVEQCDTPWWDSGECYIGAAVSAVDTDGTDHQYLKRPSYGATDVCCPSWSPRNDKIVYDWHPTFRTISPDGTSDAPHPLCCARPNWSPDGSRLVYTRAADIFVANADGSEEVRLTNNGPIDDAQPAWSPDAQQIAFQSNEGGDYEIFVMNKDGTGRAQLTDNTAHDGAPDWQPLPYPGYPRPVWAGWTVAPLVPAYAECTTPDRIHGPPLPYPSCSNPSQASSHLTVGTSDANGAAAQSKGHVRYGAGFVNPASPPDEADVYFEFVMRDVRLASDYTDYGGELELRTEIRLTDRGSGPGGDERATVQDFDFAVTVPCVLTDDETIGSRCEVKTSAEAITPGAITEGKRTIWALESMRVYDGGPDGQALSQDNTLFAVPGVFVP
jgi:hypothetical protein